MSISKVNSGEYNLPDEDFPSILSSIMADCYIYLPQNVAGPNISKRGKQFVQVTAGNPKPAHLREHVPKLRG